MRAVRSENMFRRSYFNCCPHKILYQLIAIPTVNKIQVNFTDRGEQQEKKKKQPPQKLVFIHLKNWNQIYTHQCHIYVWIILWWLICENTSSLLTLQGWVPHRSGCQPQKTETCIVLIFFLKINQDEQERQKGPQVHRSSSHCQKQLCPPWVDPGAIKPEPFPPEMLQHFFPNEVTSQKCLCFSGPSCSHQKAVLASVCSNGQQPASYFQTKFSHIWV